MAAGVPVVATTAGAIPEVVGDGALLVGPGDADDLAGAIVGVLDGGTGIDALVDRGRTRAARSHGRRVPKVWPFSTPMPTGFGTGRIDPLPRSQVMTDLRLLMLVEQLRRTASGGIGTYVRGLIQGLDRCRPRRRPELELLASRPASGRAGADLLSGLGHPVRSSALPGPLMTRAWDRGLIRAPSGFDVVQATSLSTLEPGRAALVVTVHDLLWRRVPDAYPRRGRSWHESALRATLRRADRFVVPADVVADDLAEAGAPADAITVIPMGSDHLPPPDRAAADRPPVAHGHPRAVPSERRHARAPQEPGPA